MRFATALGIDDLLRACTYESVYDGDAEILSRRFGEEKSESARQNVVGGGSRATRSGSIDRENARLAFGPKKVRDSDLSIGTHGERALLDAPLVVCM